MRLPVRLLATCSLVLLAIPDGQTLAWSPDFLAALRGETPH
ncbi:MAG: hypothetical protein WAM82_07435 [Thermoanaerobaculia bacterium]